MDWATLSAAVRYYETHGCYTLIADAVEKAGGRVALAKALGKPPQTIHYWVHSERSPRVENIVLLVEFMEA